MTRSPDALLPAVVAAAEGAGRRIATEFSRPGGPRGAGGKAPVDTEVEAELRGALTALLPEAGWVGEETGRATGAGGLCWLVDPHDGTSDFLNGHRGTAVSVGLLRDGKLVAPARFVALPSIAYRLARAACGDGVAGLSLNGPVGWDYCGGHALLLGAGGVLLDRRGAPVRYAADGGSAAVDVVGGTPRTAEALAARDWSGVREGPLPPRVTLGWPRPQAGVALERAVGCLLGQVIGDALGALVEFQDPARIALRYPQGVRDLADGGTWNTFAGQPTDDSELALALARRLAISAAFDLEGLAEDYAAWVAGGPFDIGGTTRRGLGAAASAPPRRRAAAAMAAASQESQANGALMRVSPAGIWARSADEAAEVARMDARLSHPHPVCQDASAAFAIAIWTGIAGGTPAEMLAAARAEAGETAVRDALDAAAAGRDVEDFLSSQGWVLVAFRNAFFHLLHTLDAEAALIATVGAGGDTDTNAAICGALLGAAAGRAAFPARWVMPVLACRPLRGLGARRPRPATYWPDDLPDLAEALLMRRLAGDPA